MKKFSWIFIILCCTWFAGCKEDDNGGPAPEDGSFTLMDGSIVVTNNLNLTIKSESSFPLGVSTEADFSVSRKKFGLKAAAEGDSDDNELRGYDYRFKKIGDVSTLTFDKVEVQATHVKIIKKDNINYYAFVTYNERGNGYHGALVVYEVELKNINNIQTLEADIKSKHGIVMNNAELSAVDYYNNKLYVTGASVEPKFGYESKDKGNRAFYMVLDLDPATKKFKINENGEPVEPYIKKLTSFQGTSIRVANDMVYVTTGDGTEGTQGGMYVFNAADNSQVAFISDKQDARSADIDAKGNVYLMQARNARVTRYDREGKGENKIYDVPGEAMQQYAKTEITVGNINTIVNGKYQKKSNEYLFVAENESGLRMLDKEGNLIDQLAAPGEDKEKHVTNSVAVNTDEKMINSSEKITSNLLLLANGEKGVCWYDVMNVTGKDKIVLCNENSIFAGDGSANFIASIGNIVFVADGLGGLKILYIGFDNGAPPPPVGKSCTDFMKYLFTVGDAESLLPEGSSVFRPGANPIITTLFSEPADVIKYIEVEHETDLFISYIGEWAGWKNSLGYFVIPSTVPQNDAAELAYYNSKKNDIYTLDGTYVLNDKYTIFKNISDVNEGGPLTPSDLFQIGTEKFKAGDRVVLLMAPNGWSSQNNRVEVFISEGHWNQVFTTNCDINNGTKVPYFDEYKNFKGVQHNAFYSADCSSIVMFFEDNHGGGDVDYNDIVFSITDNKDGYETTKIKLPKWSIVENKDTKKPELVLTTELKK